jgi:epoxyqueuosine reductase
MNCQTICPENKTFMTWFDDGAEFSEHETACFIEFRPIDPLPRETAVKLARLHMDEDYRILGRNLSMLVKRAGGGQEGK